jgi:hypothetical protein
MDKLFKVSWDEISTTSRTMLIKADTKEHAKLLWDNRIFSDFSISSIENEGRDERVENIEIVEIGNVIHE